ncbi:MAG: TonB-dependent receptor plug domain-containing protein, partial [Archangium sp.]
MSLRLGGQLSYLDRTLKALIPADQNVSLSALPRYWDGQAQWSYQPSSALAISATAMTSSDKLIDWFGSAEGVTPGTIKLNNSFWRGVVNTTWKPNEAVTAKLVLGGGIDRYAQPSFDLQVRKFQARPEVTWAAMKSLSFDLGGEYLVERMQGSLADASALPLDATLTTPATVGPHTFHAVGTFLSAVWQPSEGLSILPGLRVEHYSHTHELTADPRVMVRYELLKGQPGIESLVAKAGVGSFHRPPSQLQTDSQIGNPALESEAATHYLLGVEYRPTRQLLVDIAGFYVDRQNVIVSSSQRVTRNDVSVPEVFSNTGTGQTRGVEVFARQELWKNLDGWLSYTFAVSDLTSTTGGTALLSPFDQTHVLVAALAYRLPEGWKLTTRWQYASGNPTTAITGSIFDSSTNQYLPISGPTMGARMPDYHQMDLRIDKTWDLKQARLTTYLDVRNVYNRANLVEPLTYVYDYSAQKGRTGLPVLPLLGIRAEY